MNIEIKNIKKSYYKNKILKGVSFKASSGDCIGIIGENGCGKTTLLSILAGIIPAKDGTFFIDDIDIFSNKKMLSHFVGYVPQNNSLMEDLSAKDNLKLWYCDSVLDMKEELEDGVLRMLGINDFLNKKVCTLSGGMKKRLSIGCAVANAPQILILDEPGSALDLICKKQIEDYLINFRNNNGIIIMATHEEQEIKKCDSLLILKNGVVTTATYSDNINELIGQLV